MLFTNVREDAPWRSTVFSTNPWTTLPKLMMLKCFTVHHIKFDLMHIFQLGIGRDVAATAIKELIKAHIFQGDNRKERFASAFLSLKTWAKVHGKSLALRKFSKENLYWYSDTCPAPYLQFCSSCFVRFCCAQMGLVLLIWFCYLCSRLLCLSWSSMCKELHCKAADTAAVLAWLGWLFDNLLHHDFVVGFWAQ